MLASRIETLAADRDEARNQIGLLSHSARNLSQQLVERSTAETPARFDGPLVSVVMAVWNRRNVVKRAIESVLAQRYREMGARDRR